MRKTEEKNDEVTVELQPLPDGWVWSNLGDIGLARLGKTPGKAGYRDSGEYKIVKFRDVDEHGQVDWDNANKGYVDSEPKILRTLKELKVGDVLVTASAHMSEHIGKKVGIVRNIPSNFKAAYVVGEILQIRTKEDFDPRWVLYFLRSVQGYKAIQRRVHGVHLIASRAQNIEIPVAPFAQQKRIVAEIEKQFSRLDEAIADLKRVKANLKRYKAAVLKAAVEGRLVETEASIARREDRSYETGEQLLHRILETRRSQWKGKGKYREPAAPDTTDLPELPEAWVWATVTQVADVASGNTPAGVLDVVKKTGEVPWFKVGDMNREANQQVMRHADAWLSYTDMRQLGLRLFPTNTVLFPKRGGAIATNKKRRLETPGCVDLNVMGITPREEITSYFFAWFDGVNLASLSDGSNVPQINHKDIEPLLIPIPPAVEQRRIAEEVDRRLSLVSEVEAQVDANLKRAQRLRSTTLSSAFSVSTKASARK